MDERVDSDAEDSIAEGDLERQRAYFASRKQLQDGDDCEMFDVNVARYKEMTDYFKYPDEADPLNPAILAKERYQRYRGLPEGFRNSNWDAFENLPVDYARIF